MAHRGRAARLACLHARDDGADRPAEPAAAGRVRALAAGVRGTRAAQRGAWRQAPPVPARPRPGLGAEQALAPAVPHDPPRVRHQAGLSRRPAGRTGGADQAGPRGDRVGGARARGRRPAPGLRPDRQLAGGGVRPGVRGHPGRASGRRRAVITAGSRAPSSSSRRSAASIVPPTSASAAWATASLASSCVFKDGKATPSGAGVPIAYLAHCRPSEAAGSVGVKRLR